ncbi:cytochrome-c peroxidase [Flavobacterium okayamense]|uniref:Cytochrome-c peroxidase n=1 Tax=Flavobacterium okayamense TaxID=2830782 RepID=A0ABN6HW04_9FLAO|nr:cytochrome c peroxidase [Flavobacterium okayamense]BCY28620.1 cytochrome-c peroxidase [Flavobacterium okayamense]
MNILFLKKVKKAIFLYSLFAILFSCTDKEAYQEITENEKLEVFYKKELNKTINFLSESLDNNDLESKKERYWNARESFKTIEPILAFLDYDNYNYLNQANLLKVDEEDATAIKIKKPVGYQVLEEILYDDQFDDKEYQKVAKQTIQRLKFVEKNHTLDFVKPHHILWMLRDGFLRTSLVGITSFDVPQDSQTINETIWVYNGIKEIIAIYKSFFNDEKVFSNWNSNIVLIQEKLSKVQFDTFNYYKYYKEDVFPLMRIWKHTVKDWEVVFPFSQAIDYDSENLFSDSTFTTAYFLDRLDYEKLEEEILLGKMLFEDKSLSKGNAMSCASCHQKDLYFTDGFAKSPKTNRNSPTLLYASLQKGFFHDKRTGSLEGQIIDVVENPNEFHSSLNHLEEKVKQNQNYIIDFKEVYNQEISNENIRKAISAYIASLNKFNSKFDKSMKSNEVLLTEDEQNGFNIFMGKGKCATCHFAPIFNGTVPVAYKESEIELIGVPATNDTINAKIDSDLGRYNLFKTEQRKFFFKTPTVRNVEKTGPYMHNGVFSTLEEVVDFYDNGGGFGLGIDLEYQTLPTDKLNLTKKEKEQLVLFLKTLTDEL